MTERERLMDRLFNDPTFKLLHLHITRGPGPCSEEELCAEINKAFDQVADGTAIISDSFQDDCPKVNVRTLFAR